MTDKFDSRTRSYIMSRIQKKGNKSTELSMMHLLKSHHIIGWRRHQPILGKPDFAFTKQKVVLFVDGCFWHVCPKHSNIPLVHRHYWEEKLQRNKKRDKYVSRELRKMGWVVIRIWEHELKNSAKVTTKIMKALDKTTYK